MKLLLIALGLQLLKWFAVCVAATAMVVTLGPNISIVVLLIMLLFKEK